VEGNAFFETFAPVVTVCLMLILSVILDLATKQVDYTAAFLHAPIDVAPKLDDLSEEDKKRQRV